MAVIYGDNSGEFEFWYVFRHFLGGRAIRRASWPADRVLASEGCTLEDMLATDWKVI